MEGGAAACSSSCSPENVFRDFRGRRAAIIKALTTDFDKFYQLCDPGEFSEKENLCLYGHPDGTWEVKFPAEKVPTELPEPASGINFPRDGMDLEDWVPVIADYSDSWLLAVAFYYAARFGFDKKSRMKLFNKINFVPTVYNATRKWRRQTKKKTPDNSCGACGESYGTNEFLILCSVCKRLFHGKCVKIASIEQINQYTCSDCSSDKLGTNKS